MYSAAPWPVILWRKSLGEAVRQGLWKPVLGLDLILSTLLITVPPMAGMWFNGVMATYSGYNAMQGWGTGQPATPPGHNAPVTQNQVHQPLHIAKLNINSLYQLIQ